MRKAPELLFQAGGWSGWIVLAAIAVFGAYQPGPVMSITHPAVAMNQPAPGESLLVKWYFTKHKDCAGQSVAWTEDSSGATVQIRQSVLKLEPGEYAGRVAQYPIPTTLQPGSYQLFIMLMPDCGGLIKDKPQRLPPVPFIVRDNDG